jgi:hypothetical protein
LKNKAGLILEKLRLTGFLWRYVLAAVFISAGVLKLLSDGQLLLPSGYSFLPEGIARSAELILPWLEIALGLWLFTGIFKKASLGGAFLLILVFISSNIYGLISGDSQDCHCLGSAISLTHGQSLALDILMLAMGITAFAGKRNAPEYHGSSRIGKRLWPAIIVAALSAIMLISYIPAVGLEAGKPDSSDLHPPMRPSVEQLAAWEEDYQNASVYIVPSNSDSSGTVESIPPVYSLLDLIDYVPSERDQGHAGNCWVWAGTGVMEIAMSVSTGVKDRLSTQYLDSNYYHQGKRAGCGGELSDFAAFYNGDPGYNTAAIKHIAVPWDNSGAAYQDYYLGACNTVSGTPVSTTPNYPLLSSITVQTIPTTHITQSRAIANIKSALLNKQALLFGFFLPLSGSYTTIYDFVDFWASGNANTSVFVPYVACHKTWDDWAGHAVVCVGYDDNNNSWIMLNSWGTTDGRPDGTFRITQDLDYNCTWSYTEEKNVTTFQWQTLSNLFTSTIPAVTTLEASNLGLSQATLNANLSALGDSSPVGVSFEYGTSESYGSTTPVQNLIAPGRFSAEVNYLLPNTTYHFRAKAVGSATVYGSDMSFTTTQVLVPASSNLSLGLTIGGLAAVMAFCILWRRRVHHA